MFAVLEQFVDGHLEAVRLPSETFQSDTVNFLLKKFVGVNPIIHGGALRDIFGGVVIGDYDMVIDAPPEILTNPHSPVLKKPDGKKLSYERRLAMLKDPATPDLLKHVLLSDEFFNVNASYLDEDITRLPDYFAKFDAVLEGDEIDLAINLKYEHICATIVKVNVEGIDCDIILNVDDDCTAEKIAMMGDAPINSIAMNARGEVFAHPSFVNDIAARHYNLRVKGKTALRRAEERYEKLSARYPGLRFSVMDGPA